MLRKCAVAIGPRCEYACLCTCRQVAEKLKLFAENKRVRTSAKPSLRDLSVLMKQAPQYQKELSRYSAHFSIAESCMTLFNRHVSKLCRVEQVRLTRTCHPLLPRHLLSSVILFVQSK